jgi:DNA segregation ATPase FtsK/SpoIIIE-like protein
MKKFFDKITNDSYFLKGTIGVFLCLLSLFGALNTGIVSNFFTWIISFFFGWFFYVFYLIMFLFGLRLIFARKEFKIHFNITIFGVIILFLGALILATNSITNDTSGYLTFKNFYSKFSASVQGFPLVNYDIISGGFFGYLFVAILNSGITYIGTQIVGSILLGIGFVLSLIKTAIRLIKSIQDYKNRKIQKVDSQFKMANDQTAFETSEITGAPRTTTVITPDSNIPKEHTQSIAIQNPNGGVGVGLTSINRQPSGLGKAKFNPNDFYTTEAQTTSLESMQKNESASKVENSVAPLEQNKTVEIKVADTSNVEEKQVVVTQIEPTPTPVQEEIPIASKAKFVKEARATDEVLKIAQSETIPLVGEEVKVTNAGKTATKKKSSKYLYPSLDLLSDRQVSINDPQNIEVCEARKAIIDDTLKDFNVGGEVVSYTIGPSVTRYDIQMQHNESSKAIEKYVDDIASRLKGISCRFVSVIPGKTTSGIEIPNKKSSIVNFKDCMEHLPKNPGNEFMIPFGKSISGEYVEADFLKFPHLLVSGTTGSGKSIFMHTLILTLIMRNKISDLRLILIDPKRVEFNKYKNLPFLLCPPINDGDDAYLVLDELVKVMEERFTLMDNIGVEDLKQYNKYCIDHNMDPLPRIIVFIDEYADLVDGNRHLSEPVVRIAQKARAAGIHLVIATQRPSTNVITGVIKGNIPTRVALLCSSPTDSMVILGSGGAEKLLGQGDMLVMSPLLSKDGNTRVQGAFVDNSEIKNVIDFIKENNPCDYDARFCDLKEKNKLNTDEMKEVTFDKAASDEEKYTQIRQDIMDREYCSISYIQRTYGVGFPRAGKIFERLVAEGVISSQDEAGSNRGRKVLMKGTIPSNGPAGSVEQSTFSSDKKG